MPIAPPPDAPLAAADADTAADDLDVVVPAQTDDTRAATRTIALIVVLVGIAAVVLCAHAQYIARDRPGVTSPLGYYGFSDQHSYLRTVRVLADFHLPVKEADYMYGLGYPALGAIASRLGFHSDPFAPIDALLFGATIALTFVLGMRLSPRPSQRLLFGAATAGVTALSTPLLSLFSVPWNSHVVVFLYTFVLVVATWRRELNVWWCLAMGVAVGWVFSARYLDAVFIGFVVLATAVVRPAKERWRVLIAGAIGAAAIVVPVLWTQQHAFGSFTTTPYHFHTRKATSSNDQSIDEYKLSTVPGHFVGAFITGKAQGQRQPADPMLRYFPLLVVAPVGAVVLARRRSRERLVWIVAMASSVVASVFYLSFAAGGGGDLKYGNLRYWEPWCPLWAGLAVVGLAYIGLALVRLGRRLSPPASGAATASG